MASKSEIENKFALFLDRDGVINKDRGYRYVTSWDHFKFLPGVRPTLARLHDLGITVIVVTNQSCIGKGIVSERQVEEIHKQMIAEVKQAGGNIGRVYVCPHTDRDGCSCRKPLPGLLIQAAQDLQLDLSQSIVTGDSDRDIQSGHQVGAYTVLIKSSNPELLDETLPQENQMRKRPDLICHNFESLLGIVQDFLQDSSNVVSEPLKE